MVSDCMRAESIESAAEFVTGRAAVAAAGLHMFTLHVLEHGALVPVCVLAVPALERAVRQPCDLAPDSGGRI